MNTYNSCIPPSLGGFLCSQAHNFLTYDQPDPKITFRQIKKYEILAHFDATAPLNCSKVNTLGYVDDLVPVAPTAQTSLLLLNALTSNLSTLSLQANVQKSCNTVFRQSGKKVLTSLTMNNQPLRQVMETAYLGVVCQECRTSYVSLF